MKIQHDSGGNSLANDHSLCVLIVPVQRALHGRHFEIVDVDIGLDPQRR